MSYNTVRTPYKWPTSSMAEQLTLNQWVQGSSPWSVTRDPRSGTLSIRLFIFK